MINARLSVKQRDSIVDATARINIWDGSVRSGKTIASIMRWLTYVRTAPPGALALIGKTKDTVGRNIQDVINDIAPSAIAYNRGANVCRILGRQVEVIGANDAKAEAKIRGLTLAGAYVDEVTVIPAEFWKQTLARLSVPGAKLFGTTNPDNPRHWLKRDFLDRAAELNMARFQFKLDDNPSLDPEYVSNLKAEYTGLWYRRFILGEWVAADGAIWDLLDEEAHCAPAPDRQLWRRGWVAADYGTSNPTHAVLLVQTPPVVVGDRIVAPERLHAVAEWRHDGRAKGQLTDAQISARLAAWAGPLLEALHGVQTVLDPSAASFRMQLRADGWPSIRSADNRVDVGIRAVASLIAAGRLVIDKTACPFLWDEMCGYVWDETALEHGEEKPVKTDDHGPDALRYGIMAARQVWRQWLPELAAGDERAAA